jgi:hypothetical protein
VEIERETEYKRQREFIMEMQEQEETKEREEQAAQDLQRKLTERKRSEEILQKSFKKKDAKQ